MRKPLPSHDYIIYRILVPSLKREVQFRPFTVRENKALLMAQASENDIVMVDTLKQVIGSCAVEDLDVEALAPWDYEYLLLKLRAISVINTAQLIFTCNGHHDDEESKKFPLTIDLNNVEVVNLDTYSEKIELAEDRVLVMKTPDMDLVKMLAELNNKSNNLDDYIEIVAHCLKCYYVGDEIYNFDDYSIEEIVEFINDFSQDDYDKILDYFSHLPFCRIKVEWRCPICGYQNVQYITGILSFFL